MKLGKNVQSGGGEDVGCKPEICISPLLPSDGTWENLRKYEEICENMKKIWKKYKGTCGKYEKKWRNNLCRKYERLPPTEISSSILVLGLGKILSSSSLCRPWNLEIFRTSPFYFSSETWKNSDLSPYIGSGPLYSLWDLQEFREKPGGKTRETWNMIFIF